MGSSFSLKTTERITMTTSPFQPIDSGIVPRRQLASGALIPAIGLGTFGSDHVKPDDIAAAVGTAIRGGYRLIDCAACYGNEAQIGAVFASMFGRDINRSELFVISKLWNDQHKPADVAKAARRSLRDLHLDYLNAYLVHWPFPNTHAPGARPDDRDPNSRPYIHEEYMETWAAMEKLVDEGLVCHIGTSNMTIPKLNLLLRDARIAPEMNEMELHPCFQQEELFQYCLDHGIQPIGFSPIGSPDRPDRDKTPDDFSDIAMPEILAIAQAHQIHPAVVCVKWAYQRGQIPIPFSVKPSSFMSNLAAVCADPLTPEEMASIRAVERNSRLIKGQVFCWPGSDSWLDLWDVDGTIPGQFGYATKGKNS